MAGPPEKNAYLRANRTHTLGTYGALLHLVDGWHADADPPSRALDRQGQLVECDCHTPGDRLVDREFVVSAS